MTNKLSPQLILKKIDIDLSTGCWNWKGSLQTYGYGQIKLNNRNVTGHRASWIAFNGPVPDKMQVLHHCDNPRCCNPDHLYLGDRYDNMRDMHMRGRRSPKMGGGPKLTVVQRIQIKDSADSAKQLAAKYGISTTHVRWLKKQKLKSVT